MTQIRKDNYRRDACVESITVSVHARTRGRYRSNIYRSNSNTQNTDRVNRHCSHQTLKLPKVLHGNWTRWDYKKYYYTYSEASSCTETERQMLTRNRRCYYRNDKNAAGSKVRTWSNFTRTTYRVAGAAAAAARAHSQTAHVHERRGRAPVAEWLAISIFDCIYERARRAHRSARWVGLAAAARATCAHLSPPPSTRNRMVLQNKTANEGRAANVRAATGRRGSGDPEQIRHLTHAPKTEPSRRFTSVCRFRVFHYNETVCCNNVTADVGDWLFEYSELVAQLIIVNTQTRGIRFGAGLHEAPSGAVGIYKSVRVFAGRVPLSLLSVYRSDAITTYPILV